MKVRYKSKLLLFPLIFIFFSGCASTIKQTEIEINKKYSPSQLKEDFDFLFQTFKQVHPDLFLYTPENVVDSILASRRKKLNRPMTSFEFYKFIMPVIAENFDGHTFLNFPYKYRKKYLDDGGKIIPFDVRIDDQRLFVSKNYSPDSTLAPNSEIISINDIRATEILDELRKYKSGRFEARVNWYVQRMFKRLIWEHYGLGEHVNIEYISSIDNQDYTKNFSGITVAQYDSLSQRNQNNKRKFHMWTFKILPDDQIAIIDLNSFGRERDLGTFKKFLDTTFTVMQQEELQDLIIDVRGNGGGESLLGEALIDYLALKPWLLFSKADFRISEQIKADMIPWLLRWIPIKTYLKLFSFMYTSMGIEKIEFDSVRSDLLHASMKPKELEDHPLRYNGNVYVLIDNGSFSMSVMFAAFMKDYSRAILIGEETGQSANHFGGNYFFYLPNTHLRASVPSGKSYRPGGQDTDSGVLPDYEVKQTPEDREIGIDTVMEFTIQLIRKNTNGNAKAD